MPIGKTPINQLNALPLQDADTQAEGGSVQVIGGSIFRYWSAAALQINGIPMATFSAVEQAVVTPYLNTQGCTKFALALRCVNNVAARAALQPIFVLCQYRMGVSDNPAVAYINNGGAGGRDDQDNAILNLFTTGRVFALTGNAGEVQTNVWTWEPTAGTGVGSSFFSTIGSDVRLIITTSTLGMSANNLFTANLWGTGP